MQLCPITHPHTHHFPYYNSINVYHRLPASASNPYKKKRHQDVFVPPPPFSSPYLLNIYAIAVRARKVQNYLMTQQF